MYVAREKILLNVPIVNTSLQCVLRSLQQLPFEFLEGRHRRLWVAIRPEMRQIEKRVEEQPSWNVWIVGWGLQPAVPQASFGCGP